MKRALAVALASLCGVAAADVTPVPEFVGDLTETWENVQPPGGYPAPLFIFGGAAAMDDSLAHFCVIAFSWTGVDVGTILAYNGNFMGGTVAGNTIFTFDPPVTSFGGFHNTVGPAADGTIIFRDAAGAEIDTLPYFVTPLTWGWQGWTSTTPIASVEIIDNNGFGFGSQFDDLQVSYGSPCPADLSGSSDPNDPGYGTPDGAADSADFFYYLDQFVAGNIAVADLSGSSDPNDPGYGIPDGALDAADFFYYLDIFVAGCP